MRRVLASIVCCSALLACSKPEVVEHYRTRGLVTGVSGQGEDARAEIHHERIETFKDRDGKPSPMEAMEMNFAFAEGLSPKLTPGDKLSFEFDVIWSSGSPLVVTKLEPLPADTKLQLE